MGKPQFYIAKFILLLVCVSALTSCDREKNAGLVFVLGVSSDGRYVVSTDDKRRAILWDLTKDSHRVIAKPANVYSAYFVKNTPYFLWQNDKTNLVNVQSVDGRKIKEINPGLPTYGGAITSELGDYFYSDENWNIYRTSRGKKTQLARRFTDGNFWGAQKIVNFSIRGDRMLAAGSGGEGDGISLWNLNQAKPLKTFVGTMLKAFATLSPDGKYVVGGDEGSAGFVWDVASGRKLFRLYHLRVGKPIWKGKKIVGYDAKGLIKAPEGYSKDLNIAAILSLKFIDKTHYLRFTTYRPYAILYSITDPKPIKYFYLGENPRPSVDDYSRDQSIDTSPEAHILVTGQAENSGIIVYHYNPKTMTLKKIWSGTA